MGVAIELDNVDVTAYVNIPTISIQDGAASMGDSLEFDMYIPWADLDAETVAKPKPGNVVVLIIDSTREFEGVVATTDDSFQNPETMLVNVIVSDYTAFLDRRLVAKQEYAEGAAGTRIKTILQEFAPDFTDYSNWDDNIATGLDVPKEGYDYEPASGIFDRLSEATGYAWYVGFDASVAGRPKIYFFPDSDVSANASPLNNGTYSNILDLDANLEIGGVTVTEDVSSLFNVVIIKDYAQQSDNAYEHNVLADGAQSFFKLPMPPMNEVDMTVETKHGEDEWVTKTLALDPLDGSAESIEGQANYAYVCVMNWGVRFPTTDMPASGDYVKVSFDYAIPDRVAVFMDPDSINEMARREGSDGEHQVMISLPDYRIDSPSDTGYDPIEFYGNMLLDSHAWPLISGGFSIYEPSNTTTMTGWRSGQYFKIKSKVRDIYDIRHWVISGRGDWDSGDKIAVTVFITSVTKKIIQVTDGGTILMTNIEFSTRLRE